LAQIIAIVLFGSDMQNKERVYEAYERLFTIILDDLMQEDIIPDKSPLLISDLTQILLSVIFLGGSPQLRMQYTSFINPRNTALSALEALQARYQARMHESLLH
jgi:hypothetical protein